MNIFKKLFDNEYKELKKFMVIADEIEKMSQTIESLSDEELKNKTAEFKEALQAGKTLEDIKVEAFAVCREACKRVIEQRPFYVQLLGGLAIHYGNIAEMKTGEGKTLTCVLPAYLNALTGNGVHIVTVNEYLATRDSEWMGGIFRFLGLTVGLNLRNLSPKEKQEQYNCDILYSTNNEIGFDYLRDNMVIRKEDRVQRKLNYCIIDEVDSVLIDESRTPLIISGGNMKTADLYADADKVVKKLNVDEDYTADLKSKTVVLTEQGTKKCETFFKIDNLFDINNTAIVQRINQALRANHFMKLDVDYVIDDGKIVIVDQFTGRLMKGRAFSEGLHQAIEAKEGVKIQEETKTLATITFQNLFRMYSKLSGMTGTAKTEEEEFRNIYNMYVISIPTNKDIIRIDMPDLIFANKQGKYEAIVNEIMQRNEKGQPVLVGTIAIETSELISNMLSKRKVKHEVLNAKNHAREAEIIANAGEKYAVTIATNMAGRGTDIKLGEDVDKLGGLCVLGTERHESRRIDNQLRGRSGRQGDVGYTQFYVSMEDELMLRFGSDRLKGMLQAAGFDGDKSVRSSLFSKSVESAQRRVEGNNFDSRKHLLQYDDVMSEQRNIIYEKRNAIIDAKSLHSDIIKQIAEFTTNLINKYSDEKTITDHEGLIKEINELLPNEFDIVNKDSLTLSSADLSKLINERITNSYENKLKELPEEVIVEAEKAISLRVIDSYWMDHISTMAHLKEGINLRSYAQENPLQAYTMEGFQLFDDLLDKVNYDTIMYLIKSEIKYNIKREEVVKNKKTNDAESTALKPKTAEKIGRNDLCPCGSGKKYKQCCGK